MVRAATWVGMVAGALATVPARGAAREAREEAPAVEGGSRVSDREEAAGEGWAKGWQEVAEWEAGAEDCEAAEEREAEQTAVPTEGISERCLEAVILAMVAVRVAAEMAVRKAA